MRITVVTIFLILSFQLYARKPAVEPISGISIDHIKEEKPSAPKKLYDFNNKVRGPSSELKRRLPAQTYKEISSIDQSSENFSYYLLILPFLILPFIAKFILNMKVKSRKSSISLSIIDGEKNDFSENNDDDDFKQAS